MLKNFPNYLLLLLWFQRWMWIYFQSASLCQVSQHNFSINSIQNGNHRIVTVWHQSGDWLMLMGNARRLNSVSRQSLARWSLRAKDSVPHDRHSVFYLIVDFLSISLSEYTAQVIVRLRCLRARFWWLITFARFGSGCTNQTNKKTKQKTSTHSRIPFKRHNTSFNLFDRLHNQQFSYYHYFVLFLSNFIDQNVGNFDGKLIDLHCFWKRQKRTTINKTIDYNRSFILNLNAKN